MYFIFLPNNVVDCNNAGTECNTNTYCAYHSARHDGWPAFVCSEIPDNRNTATIGGCGNSNVTGRQLGGHDAELARARAP